MKVIIADDEAPARGRLRRLVEELPEYDIVGEAATGLEVLQQCMEIEPDVVLMDIRMPDMDGIEAARHISEIANGPAVIFTTAFDHYAIEAFDAQAVGYLLKPVRRERLARALELASRLSAAALATLSQATDRPVARTNICVRRGTELRLIPVDTIFYLHADQKYVTVRHADGEDLLDEALRDLAEEFPDHFIRIHRSTLIACRFLDRMDRCEEGHYQVRLRGLDAPLPVSRRHVTAVKSWLKRAPLAI
jgi:two-component system response regulator AlgR